MCGPVFLSARHKLCVMLPPWVALGSVSFGTCGKCQPMSMNAIGNSFTLKSRFSAMPLLLLLLLLLNFSVIYMFVCFTFTCVLRYSLPGLEHRYVQRFEMHHSPDAASVSVARSLGASLFGGFAFWVVSAALRALLGTHTHTYIHLHTTSLFIFCWVYLHSYIHPIRQDAHKSIRNRCD